MNTPGVSLFQGAESIKVNSTLERQEEEEMIEDQKRREAELGNILQNAFDDLDDDDDETIDSTTNLDLEDQQNHNNHPYQIQHQHNHNQGNLYENYHQQKQQQPIEQPHANLHANCQAEMHKLNMLLESRTHELENANRLVKEKHKKCDDYQKRLSITEAELERALVEKNNVHELLVDSKEKCSNLDNIIAKLRHERELIESENNDLVSKLETSQTLLAEVQQKYDMVERDFYKRDDRNAEMRVKQLEERQRAQVDLLEQQINNLSEQLNKKKQELEQMQSRYTALQHTHDSMLVSKASKINDLNSALEDAQRKCSELLSRPNYESECQRLQQINKGLQAQVVGLEKTITTLNERLSTTTAELELMDSVLHQHNLEDTPGSLSQTHGKLVGSTPMNTVDRLGQIKDELYRALANVKNKREELHKLQRQLEVKDAEISTLRTEENKGLVLTTTLREDKVRLEQRIKMLEEELHLEAEKYKKESVIKLESIKQELEAVRVERDKLQRRCEELQTSSDTQEQERKKINVQLKNVEVDLEELKQEHESMKRNYEQIMQENRNLRARTTADNIRLELERHKILLKDAQSECDRLKKLYAEISNDKEVMNYEMEKLKNADNLKELHEQREKVAQLQRSLQLTELKSSELAKLLDAEKLCHERELSALRERNEKEKIAELKAAKDNSNNCTKCLDYMAEITKYEVQTLKLNNLNGMHRKEIDELNVELKESDAIIAELKDKLKLTEHQERLITELKNKATEFEEYIKLHSSSSERSTQHSSPSNRHDPVSSSDKQDKSLSSGLSPTLTQDQIRKIEARIRNEMAQIFASELKRFQQKLQQTEEKSICLQREYHHVCAELQQRQTEVELLKQAILAEREKVDEILREKDADCQQIVHKQKTILTKCRDELKAKNQRITELCRELEDRQTQIEAERQSMKAVMEQWETQRKSIDSIESEWREKMQEMREAHDEAIKNLQKKYSSAKRTMLNYQRYSEDKEEHFKRELERIKRDYELSLVQMEVRITKLLAKKNSLEAAAATETQNKHKGSDKENMPTNS